MPAGLKSLLVRGVVLIAVAVAVFGFAAPAHAAPQQLTYRYGPITLGPYEVDFLWRDRALVVETDGFRHHSDRAAFESDRVRDAAVQRFGFRVLRFTYRQVTEDRTSVVAALRDLLGERPLTPNL